MTSTPTEFRHLTIDAVFEFDHSRLPLSHGLAQGPWRKVSPRKYVRLDDGMECTIGKSTAQVVLYQGASRLG